MELHRALRVARQDLIALVGAGGKSSAMFRLGEELAGMGWRVVLTTSTRIGTDQIDRATNTLLLPLPGVASTPQREQRDPLTPSVTTALQLAVKLFVASPTLLIAEIDPRDDKGIGLRPDVIDRLVPQLGLEAVINEADGARSLPFKAPADHEPVIPASTTRVVPIVGIDVVGQPLDEAHVHRPERVAALTGARPGQPVTLETVAAVLIHPEGGLKGVPTGARVIPLINKVHTDAQAAVADRLADLLLAAPRVQAVAVGAVQEPDPVRAVKSRVAVVVLAAGESRRFGRLKQLEPWGEGTLLTHAVEVALASRADRVFVVLGCQADACRAALGERPVSIVVNPDWAAGQSTSVQAGLAALPGNFDAVLFHLADQPGVTAAVIDALVERHAATLAPVLWPEYRGRRGNPALFDRSTFPEFESLKGDVGARPVLLAHARAGTAEAVAVDEEGVLSDVDTPDDLPGADSAPCPRSPEML